MLRIIDIGFDAIGWHIRNCPADQERKIREFWEYIEASSTADVMILFAHILMIFLGHEIEE